ncbi:MAG: TlpA family protein disulfide reductase [Oscillospiraceae bacterium]|nr:TlpA family protein disulfide reductase [Oscillospiraceae bacterium]
MKTKLFLVLILVLSLLIAGCGKTETAPTEATVSTTAPAQVGSFGAFEAEDLLGNKVTESIFAGHKVTMVNIWGTFCNPCINEMPDLAQLNKDFDGLQVVGIVIDAVGSDGKVIAKTYDEAVSIVKSTGADYTHLLPSPSLAKCCLSGVTSIPVTIFVDGNGDIIGNAYIGSRSYPQWAAIISSLPLE